MSHLGTRPTLGPLAPHPNVEPCLSDSLSYFHVIWLIGHQFTDFQPAVSFSIDIDTSLPLFVIDVFYCLIYLSHENQMCMGQVQRKRYHIVFRTKVMLTVTLKALSNSVLSTNSSSLSGLHET